MVPLLLSLAVIEIDVLVTAKSMSDIEGAASHSLKPTAKTRIPVEGERVDESQL
jgi:hypothetical protein